MSSKDNIAIILAAGMGTRMQSSLPKVMHQIAGQPMVAHVFDTVLALGCKKIGLVGGPDMDTLGELGAAKFSKTDYFIQKDRLGTAHAVLAAKKIIPNKQGVCFILYGDTPLIHPSTLNRMKTLIDEGGDIVVLGFKAADPTGYGRLLVNKEGKLLAIREEKDASEEEKKVQLCNSGVMAFQTHHMLKLLTQIDNKNASKEYYLTDAVEVAVKEQLNCRVAVCDENQVLGVNDRLQLARAETLYQTRKRREFLLQGITMMAPSTVYFSYDTQIGRDSIIEPNVFFGTDVSIAPNVTIKANSHIEGASIDEGAVVGPFARLRPGTELAKDAKVGNFCEIKKSHIGPGAKINHLSYIGDAQIGARANIGAGTITCNYDGYSKFQTIVGEGAFVGSNSSLIAPVTIGKEAYVGSGSAISKDVAPSALALTRNEQIEKADWATEFKKSKDV